MSSRSIALLALALLCAGCHSIGKADRPGDPKVEIGALIEAQTAAWNRGDIAAFMQGYWKDDAVRFASDGTESHGWQQTLAHYQSRYGDQAAMGKLELSELDIRPLAPDAAYVFGHWKLVRDKDQPHGLFTLILKRGKSGWHIVHDHSSSAS
jgi:uncharacterized protein (TIGR02246 family)